MEELSKPLRGRNASEVFLEYCEPLINELIDGSHKELKTLEKSLRLPWIIWNSTVLSQKNKTKVDYFTSAKILSRKLPYANEMIDFWKQRKIQAFNEYRYLMGNFQVVPTVKGEFTLIMEARFA